jgi:hypothetical protein
LQSFPETFDYRLIVSTKRNRAPKKLSCCTLIMMGLGILRDLDLQGQLLDKNLCRCNMSISQYSLRWMGSTILVAPASSAFCNNSLRIVIPGGYSFNNPLRRFVSGSVTLKLCTILVLKSKDGY